MLIRLPLGCHNIHECAIHTILASLNHPPDLLIEYSRTTMILMLGKEGCYLYFCRHLAMVCLPLSGFFYCSSNHPSPHIGALILFMQRVQHWGYCILKKCLPKSSTISITLKVVSCHIAPLLLLMWHSIRALRICWRIFPCKSYLFRLPPSDLLLSPLVSWLH